MNDDTKDPLLSIIPGNPTGLYTEKQQNINNHIEHTKKEFCGQPQVCFEVARLIILIRRKQNIANNYAEFQKLSTEYSNVLCNSMTTRWLVSVLDTISDYGEQHQKAGALSVSVFVNMLIVSDTIMDSLEASEVPSKPFDTNNSTKYGCMMLNTQTGDNVYNFIQRINLAAGSCDLVSSIWREIHGRIKNTENSLSLLKKIHKGNKFF